MTLTYPAPAAGADYVGSDDLVTKIQVSPSPLSPPIAGCSGGLECTALNQMLTGWMGGVRALPRYARRYAHYQVCLQCCLCSVGVLSAFM